MQIPSEHDLNPYDDLDGRTACRHFLGKSLAEAQALFCENDIYYQEDLMWMGSPAFCYYVQAAMQHVRSGPASATKFLAHLVGTIEFRVATDLPGLRPAADVLVAFLVEIQEPTTALHEAVRDDGQLQDRASRLESSLRDLLA